MARPVRLAYLVSHPIQYQAPLLRRIAAEPGIDLTVLFGSDFSTRGYQDEGFGVNVAWDVPLLQGYRYEFLPRLRDPGTVGVFAPLNRKIFSRLQHGPDGRGFDALWVHGYASANAIHGMIAAKALDIPVLLRSDSSLTDRPRSPAKLAAKGAFFAGLSHLVSGILTAGTLNARYWSFYFGESVPQFLMPYAVDNDFFQRESERARPRRAELRRELQLDPDRPIILFASKLQRRKRCIDLLRAHQALVSSGHPAQPYLVIVGDGEERPALEAFAQQHGGDRVRFCGFRNQSELPRFFDLASVFVLPADHEPWGLIVNEVMNAGRAVIVSDEVGAQPDLITDGVEGFVYPVGNVDALAKALAKVLASPETAQAMGHRALERIAGWDFETDVKVLSAALQAVTRGAT